MKSKYLKKGSFTIEATFVFPLIFILILFVIWYGFWLHDFIVLKAYGVMMAEESRMAINYCKMPGEDKIYAPGFLDDETKEELSDMVRSNYLGVKQNVIAGTVNKVRVEVEEEALVEIKYSPASFKYGPKSLALEETQVKTGLSFENPVNLSRITMLIYRLIKTVVK